MKNRLSYKGRKFKNEMDIRIAFFLERLGVKWTYRNKKISLDDGREFIPDFILPDMNYYFKTIDTNEEVKQEDLELLGDLFLKMNPGGYIKEDSIETGTGDIFLKEILGTNVPEEVSDIFKDKDNRKFLNPLMNQKSGRKYFFLIETLNLNKNGFWAGWMCHDQFFHQLEILHVFSHILSSTCLIRSKKDFDRSLKIFENKHEYLIKSFDYAINKKI